MLRKVVICYLEDSKIVGMILFGCLHASMGLQKRILGKNYGRTLGLFEGCGMTLGVGWGGGGGGGGGGG